MSIQSDKLLLIETEKLQKSKGTPTTSLFFFAAAESFYTNINHFKVNLRGVVVFCLKIIRYKRKGTVSDDSLKGRWLKGRCFLLKIESRLIR